jgi:hypothetical protein
MRYYKIIVSNPKTGAVVRSWTSFVNGQTIPGALNIEININITQYAFPSGAGWIRIWGVSLADISQAVNFGAAQNSITPGMSLVIYAGMQKGLPLANPAQAGLIFQGTIQQAFGNWIGTNQSIDFIVLPPTGSPSAPINVISNWLAGMPLATAIANTLTTAFPGLKTPDIQISPNLVLAYDEPGFYGTLTEYAEYVYQRSKDVIGGNYQGVSIQLTQDTFVVRDGTTQQTPKQIAFQDMIGQPTWIEGPVLQVNFVMRADLNLQDWVTLPKAVITSTAAAPTSLINLKPTFQGTCQITQLWHFGNFRQPDAASWVTVANMVPVQYNPTQNAAKAAFAV